MIARRRTRGFALHVLGHGGARAVRTRSGLTVTSRPWMRQRPTRLLGTRVHQSMQQLLTSCSSLACRLQRTTRSTCSRRHAELQRPVAGRCVTVRPCLAHFHFHFSYYLGRRAAALSQTQSIPRLSLTRPSAHESRPTTDDRPCSAATMALGRCGEPAVSHGHRPRRRRRGTSSPGASQSRRRAEPPSGRSGHACARGSPPRCRSSGSPAGSTGPEAGEPGRCQKLSAPAPEPEPPRGRGLAMTSKEEAAAPLLPCTCPTLPRRRRAEEQQPPLVVVA